MVETFTPAVCGSRLRQRLAIALFALAALVASAVLGATLGFVGSLVGTRPALIAAAALAFLAALREAGILRLPLPQSRRQVPERWQYELPLPLWSAGYGAGLGLGFLTFQPVATFWVACAAALALGKPVAAAGCFALYGAGRAFMAVWPRHREPSGPAAVERLVGRASFVPRANAIVLGLAVVLLAVAPAAGAAVTSLGRGFDPAAEGKTLARARMDSGTIKVLVAPPAPDPMDTVSPANAPALDGNYLAYEDDQGIKVIDWRNDTPVRELDGPYSQPALDYPLLAYIRDDGAHERLVLADISKPNPDEQDHRLRAQRSRPRPAGASRRTARLAPHRPRRLGYLRAQPRDERPAGDQADERLDGGESVRDLEAHRLGRAPPAGLVSADEVVREQAHENAHARERAEDSSLDDGADGPDGLCDEVDAVDPKSSRFAGKFLTGDGSLY